MTAASGDKAVSNGRAVKTYDTGMCLKYVRDPCWRVPSLYGDAYSAWLGSTKKHAGDRNPPNGAPVFYSGGSHGYGHAVIYVGGNMRSTDNPSSGKVGETDLDWPVRAWGMKYLGWTGDLNGVSLPLSSSSGGGDDMELGDPITEWSPDNGTSPDKTTVGKTLNQARGYAEDAYDRVKQLEKKVDQILAKLT